MYCKNGAIRCDNCYKFCVPYDQETPFGCSNYDPPFRSYRIIEPYDPYDYCNKCADELYSKWLDYFQQGGRNGYWQKSKAEIKAAEESGLVWVHNMPRHTGKIYCYENKKKHLGGENEKQQNRNNRKRT